jgi:uncharacterized protein YfaS (alpha-2-macroglobulin family)
MHFGIRPHSSAGRTARRHEAARFYADYLPAGHYHLSYGAQAMAEGQFSASATKAEEMYDPDVYGKGLPGQVTVGLE